MEELIFCGQGGELFVGEGDASAEERIKSLLSEGDRGLMRRRIVRRPISGGTYASSQPLGLSERDGSLLSIDPLSELLSHLTASRAKAHEPMARLGRERDAAGLSGLAALALEETGKQTKGLQLDLPVAANSERSNLRARFVQDLILSSLASPADSAAAPPPAQPATKA